MHPLTSITILLLLLAGCQYQTDLQTQRRKHHDRHQILEGKPTQFYSQWDASVWSDGMYEPRLTSRRK